MEWNGPLGWTLRLGGLVAILASLLWYQHHRSEQAALSEKLRVVATVASVSLECRDDAAPFLVTIRNLASRTVVEATFTMLEVPMAPPTSLPFGPPTVTLEAPLPPGQVYKTCHALNRYVLMSRGVDPHRIHFTAMPTHILFR
jgi:hypothetical protein